MGFPFQTDLDGRGKVVTPKGFYSRAITGCLRNRRGRLAWGGRNREAVSSSTSRLKSTLRNHRGKVLSLRDKTTGTFCAERGRPVCKFQAFQLITLFRVALPGGPGSM